MESVWKGRGKAKEKESRSKNESRCLCLAKQTGLQSDNINVGDVDAVVVMKTLNLPSF